METGRSFAREYSGLFEIDIAEFSRGGGMGSVGMFGADFSSTDEVDFSETDTALFFEDHMFNIANEILIFIDAG